MNPAESAAAILDSRWSQRLIGHPIFQVNRVHASRQIGKHIEKSILLGKMYPASPMDVDHGWPRLGLRTCGNDIQLEVNVVGSLINDSLPGQWQPLVIRENVKFGRRNCGPSGDWIKCLHMESPP